LDLKLLIKKCKKQDRAAQHFLYILFKDRLFALALKYCKNYDEAQDVLQDAFIAIFKNIKNYRGNGSFEGWIKRIVINRAIDRYKNAPYITAIDEKTVGEDTSIVSVELPVSLKEMLNFIQELPDRYRLVFNLYELDNYSHAEISKKLEISEGTSKSNLHRAKILLKKKLEAYIALKKNSIVNGY